MEKGILFLTILRDIASEDSTWSMSVGEGVTFYNKYNKKKPTKEILEIHGYNKTAKYFKDGTTTNISCTEDLGLSLKDKVEFINLYNKLYHKA